MDHVEAIGGRSGVCSGNIVCAGARFCVGLQPVGFGLGKRGWKLFALEFIVGRVWRLFALGVEFVHFAERGDLLGEPLGFREQREL